ncbi:hypothetical protein PN36_30695 [Candidatus Thiomargarita nelsonii]|uniref:Uncharacterized protein n=1 Tax=Candidatus Thiomargarita nelsonii TaxID=1003181 RepID=A0A0A6PAR6_9GAMM|nr:hypothetical protein PN36_20875 [Candidatus Thiomargarita nelsonii]TGO02087.1 hypothetical protein PN36_30695 [Candidatus Thiomargarita nelsonii]
MKAYEYFPHGIKPKEVKKAWEEWRKIEIDSSKKIKGGMGLFKSQKGKAARQLKATRPQYALKKSKEGSIILKIGLNFHVGSMYFVWKTSNGGAGFGLSLKSCFADQSQGRLWGIV